MSNSDLPRSETSEQMANPVPEERAAPQAAPPAAPSVHPLDMRVLRHPTEGTRFALASVASSVVVAFALFVVVSLGQVSGFFYLALFVVVLFVLIWLVVQLFRVRLLGDGVRVSSDTLPEVQAVMDIVRERLNFAGRVDVFVVDQIGRVLPGASPITLTSAFGVNVIVAEGGALGSLTNEHARRRLVFALATYVGALKARQTRWSPYLLALQMSGLAKFAFPFVYPWYRATVFTGDRIAYACCGDLDVSLHAVYEVLVGKEVAPKLRAAGLLGQALAVRRNTVLRLSQLLRPVPHTTNRYLELLSFAADREPAAFESYEDALGGAPSEANRVLARLRRRRPLPHAAPIGLALSVLVILGGILAGVRAQESEFAQGLTTLVSTDTTGTDGTSTAPEPGTVPVVPAEPSSPVETPSPTEASAAVGDLIALLPAAQRDTCVDATSELESVSKQPILAGVACILPTTSSSVTVSYFSYGSKADMQAEFDRYAGNLPEAPCKTGNGRSTWTSSGVERGPLGCFLSDKQEPFVVWASDENMALGLATDSSMSVEELHAWWKDNGGL